MNHAPRLRPDLRLSACTAAIAVFAALATGTPAAQAADAAPSKATVLRGKYLVNTSGCTDCHTPMKMGANGPEPDMSRMLAGHPEGLQMPPAPVLPAGPWIATVGATMTAWSGPWGTSFTANLTPDAETGLGRWTAKDFRATIRTGRHLGRGRPILPPMPIPVVQNFTDADLDAIFAYLQSIPAVKNRVPEPIAPTAPTAPAAPGAPVAVK